MGLFCPSCRLEDRQEGRLSQCVCVCVCSYSKSGLLMLCISFSHISTAIAYMYWATHDDDPENHKFAAVCYRKRVLSILPFQNLICLEWYTALGILVQYAIRHIRQTPQPKVDPTLSFVIRIIWLGWHNGAIEGPCVSLHLISSVPTSIVKWHILLLDTFVQ